MKVQEKGKYISSEDDMVLKMREEEMKLTQLLAPIDITLNDFMHKRDSPCCDRGQHS